MPINKKTNETVNENVPIDPFYLLPMTKVIDLEHLNDFHSVFFYLVIDKLIIDKTQNIFSFIVKHSGFIKYLLNKLD